MNKRIRQSVAVGMITLLSVSAVLPAFGEEEAEKKRGWQQEEDGRWFYLDSNGERTPGYGEQTGTTTIWMKTGIWQRTPLLKTEIRFIT